MLLVSDTVYHSQEAFTKQKKKYLPIHPLCYKIKEEFCRSNDIGMKERTCCVLTMAAPKQEKKNRVASNVPIVAMN